MKQGFVKAASATPAIRVADPVYNAQVICEQMEEYAEKRAIVNFLMKPDDGGIGKNDRG